MSGEDVAENDQRPQVRTGSSGKAGIWVFIVAMGIVAYLLFQALSAQRLAMQRGQQGIEQVETGGRIASPPPLNIRQYANDLDTEPARIVAPTPVVRPAPPEPRVITRYVERPSPQRLAAVEPAQPMEITPTRITVEPQGPQLTDTDPDRVKASRFSNPSLTVPKGTIIASVLETALDSTRPGFARAVVTRDVYGFDGSRVLIPRGSKLLGEYQSDLEPGQKRALVVWQRLMRPDGVMIELASPAADPLGRTGIKGKVDSHFFQRFGGAILQSVLDIGVNVASRRATDDTVVVAMPGSATSIQGNQQAQIRPTLKVKHGASVSVFVAKDLDFSTVDI